jgi:AraC family transcriptional activator of pobA
MSIARVNGTHISVAEPDPMSARVSAFRVASHFGPREWRLSSPAAREFDHGLLLESGEAWVTTLGGDVHTLAPALVWGPAMSVERLTVQAGGSGHLLAVRRDLIEQTVRQMPEAAELLGVLAAEQPLVLSIDAQTVSVLSRTISLISSELREVRPGAPTLITAALAICLVQLWRQLGASAIARDSTGGSSAALLMRFRQLVEERFREHWPVARYAETLGVTPDRLHAICMRVLGRSPRVLVQQRVMYEAVARLERSAVTIKQLAFILGFKDAAYFNRVFSRQLGIPPARYRRENARLGAAGRAPQAPFAFGDWP